MKKMKMNLFALIAVAIAAVSMSFNLANTATNPWHFTGSTESPGDYANVDNWEPGAAGGAFSCEDGGTKPCEITVPATSKPELDAILSGLTNQEVLDINPSSTRF